MLLEFRVENHRSIRDEQALTMEAASLGDPADPRPRVVPGHRSKVLTTAAIYGANASGKSNLLAALGFMKEAVLLSHRAWPPEGGVPREPFAWGPKKNEPSTFEVTLLINGIKYQYGFVVDDQAFLEEWLYVWPKGRKQTWIEREGEEFLFGDFLRGENHLIEQITRPNALFLSAAVQHKHQQLQPLYDWFLRMATVAVRHHRRLAMGNLSTQWFRHALREEVHEEDEQLRAFRELLKAADVGVVDFKLESSDTFQRGLRSQSGIYVRHQSVSEEAWLPLEEESEGTLTLFTLGPKVLEVIRHGGLLVIDELEASLHPLLAVRVLRQFNDPDANPHNAQLLFTTHDTNLLGNTLGNTALRRDQVWLTEKDTDGATCAYPLTDYKPRKAENLERGYLQGRYGAIPLLGELDRIAG